MIFRWLKKTNSKNSSDNNITINTNKDILYEIGVNLGEIKGVILNNETRLNNIEKKIKNHNQRIKKLENNKKSENNQKI